ncbi:MAG: InlB B-repeat-containing protein, partial [Clostridia bacterium]|nr:InlB B-repeat-containing protein [Clostridia bacterium]
MGRGFKKSFALSLCIVIMLGVVLAGVLFETPAKAQSVIYSDWSEWSTTAVSATDSREVQTKTVSEYWRTRYDYDYYCTWHAGASAADAYEYSNTGGNWHFYVHDSSNPNNWWYYSVYSYTKNVQAYPAGYYMNVTPGQILSKANGQLPGSTAYMDYCKNSGNKTGYALRADQSGQEQGRNQIVFLVGSQDEYRDVTYYRYRTITKTYTVRFDANGGSGAPSNQTKIHGKTLTLSSTKPTRTGYTFNHWDAWPNGGGASYMPGGQFTYNDDSTLYAIWEPHTYTVSYNANGGTGAPSSQTKTYGVDLKLSNQIPTRTGYTFLGWSKSSTATTATYPYAGTYTDNAGATLYAVWQVKSYTLTYILSGEVYQTTTYNYGASVEPAPTPPERDNMTFAGWTTATPKIMPAYNVTIRGGYGLQFGSYPQSEVTDEETIELLNSKVNDGDWISYNYYSGTGVSGSMVASDYMEYVDLDIDGDGRNDYRGVVMHNFRPYKTYEAHTYNRQESNGYRNLEKVYWFSYDPLYWTVIDQETGLCVCDTIIDAQAFNNTMSSDDSKIDIDGSYVSDYKNSDIRIWLNNDFRNTAFTFTEKTFLTLSEVDNPKSLPINMGFATETFNDYVFLLSKEQIADANIPYVSKYCAIQGFCGYVDRFTNVNIQNTDNKNYCLTRTAYSKLLQLTDTVCISGSDPVKAYDASYGIRPAITMKLSALDSTTEYTLTYRLNGKIYAQETHRAGEVIVPIDEPEVPEGQYFSGWQPDVPYVMPIGDLTINGSIGMPFGSYPQSQVTDIDLIATLNNTVQQDDWTSYNYYSGTGEEGTAVSSDYMEYADIDIDNDGTNDYRGVILHQYRPTLTYNERDAGNSTQYANNFMLNEVYWFRYDPLYWIVISDEIDENEEKTGNSVLMCT